MAITLSPKSELLQIASSLLRVQLSEFADDWKFSSSTPKKDVRRVLTAIAKHNNLQRETAIRIKNIYDKLTKIDKEEKFGEWQICPVCNGTGQAMNHRNMIPLTIDTCTRCNGEKTIERPSLKTKKLKEALGEIEKSLYIGDDLNDKEILHFYVEVVKTIKKEIHKALNNNQ